jgi:hypothetical protein
MISTTSGWLSPVQVTTPVICGTPPSARFRHVAVLVDVPLGSLLETRLAEQLPHVASLASGHTVLVHGGRNSFGEVYGGAAAASADVVLCSFVRTHLTDHVLMITRSGPLLWGSRQASIVLLWRTPCTVTW